MTGRNEGQGGAMPRYTVSIDLPQLGKAVQLRSCTSQGEHRAAATAVQAFHRRQPEVVIGAVSIAEVEHQYQPELDDIVDYWDVA